MHLLTARSKKIPIAFECTKHSLSYQRLKLAAMEGGNGKAMGRREKTSTVKIRDGVGAASSSLDGESACTHQGAKGGTIWCVGGTNGTDPRMESGGRFGFQGDPSVDWCDQLRVWSNAAGTTSPLCTFSWFDSHVGELEAPMVALEKGVGPISKTNMIMHTMEFYKTTASHVIGRGGRTL